MLSKRLGTVKNSSVVVKDDTPLVDPGKLVVGGQLEPGLTLLCCSNGFGGKISVGNKRCSTD